MTTEEEGSPSQQASEAMTGAGQHVGYTPADYLPSLPGALEPSSRLSAETNLAPMISSCRTAPGPQSNQENISWTSQEVDVTVGP